MKITRAKGQFLYDDGDGKKVKEYLDCVNCVAHGKISFETIHSIKLGTKKPYH